MGETLCLDASFLVKMALIETGTEEAQRLATTAVEDQSKLVVPSFALAEVFSVLRRRVYQGLLTLRDAEDIMETLFSLQLEEVSGSDIYRRAWIIAEELGMPVIYDTVYLAVAELRDATFWTADEVLYRKVCDRGYVRLLQGR